MDLPPRVSAPPPAQPARRGRLILRVSILILILLLLAVFLLLALSHKSNRQFQWLTDEQFSRSMKPNSPTRLADKLQSAVDSLWQHFHANHPEILINCSVLLLSPMVTAQTNLGAPAYTNALGARAWILSPAQRAALQMPFQLDPGVFKLTSARIQTSDGTPCRMSSDQSVPLAPHIYTNVGTTIDLRAKSSPHSVNLLLRACITELSPTDSQVAINTNFFAACRVVIPDAGAVVIDSGPPSAPGQPTYWLIVSPVQIDPRGVPINSRPKPAH